MRVELIQPTLQARLAIRVEVRGHTGCGRRFCRGSPWLRVLGCLGRVKIRYNVQSDVVICFVGPLQFRLQFRACFSPCAITGSPDALPSLAKVLFCNIKIPGYSLKKAISLRAVGKESIPSQLPKEATCRFGGHTQLLKGAAAPPSVTHPATLDIFQHMRLPSIPHWDPDTLESYSI